MNIPLAPWRRRYKAAFGVVPHPSIREQFLALCSIEGDCWIWMGQPTISIGKKRIDPVSMGYVLLKGDLPEDGASVGTSCGKVCCQPSHLKCSTEAETAE